MKNYADKKRRELEFEVGDLVLVKLQPYRQNSIALRKNQKLSMKYFGPFNIKKKISSVAYQLELPETAKIHNVFHISILKKFRGDQKTPYIPLPLQTTDQGPMLIPTAVVGSRVILQKGKEVQQIQVQWGPDEAAERSWEVLAEFRKAYPNSTLRTRLRKNGRVL